MASVQRDNSPSFAAARSGPRRRPQGPGPTRHPQRGRARTTDQRRVRQVRRVPALDDLLALARRHDDVVTVADAAALGITESVLRGRVVSGRWQRAHRGVYITHNGPPSWRTTARAALAYAGAGAALSHASAAYLHEFGVARPRAVEVTLPHRRRVEPSPGIALHRALRRDIERRGGLLVVTRAETALDLAASAADADAVVAAITAAARAGAWPSLVADAAGHRPTMPNRSLVLEMVRWADLGVESALELPISPGRWPSPWAPGRAAPAARGGRVRVDPRRLCLRGVRSAVRAGW